MSGLPWGYRRRLKRGMAGAEVTRASRGKGTGVVPALGLRERGKQSGPPKGKPVWEGGGQDILADQFGSPWEGGRSGRQTMGISADHYSEQACDAFLE